MKHFQCATKAPPTKAHPKAATKANNTQKPTQKAQKNIKNKHLVHLGAKSLANKQQTLHLAITQSHLIQPKQRLPPNRRRPRYDPAARRRSREPSRPRSSNRLGTPGARQRRSSTSNHKAKHQNKTLLINLKENPQNSSRNKSQANLQTLQCYSHNLPNAKLINPKKNTCKSEHYVIN